MLAHLQLGGGTLGWAQGLWDWGGDTQRAAGWLLGGLGVASTAQGLSRGCEERVWSTWDAGDVTMFGDSMRTWITWGALTSLKVVGSK